MFWILSLIVLLLALSFWRASLERSFIFTGVWLAALSLLGEPGWFGGGLLWLVYGAAALLLLREDLRARYLVAPAFAFMQKVLPSISDTERTALEAGTVSWDGELFSGRPDFGKLFATPMPRLSAREQAFLDGPVETFLQKLDGWKVNEVEADLPAAAWTYLKKEKFFGMIIPEEYGGLGFSALAHSEVLARIGSHPAGMVASSIVAVPNSLGPAELLLKYGTDEQKSHYLPRLAVGEDIPCFALTSPWAGSDAASIPDHGVICKGEWEGEEVVGMRLTWDKRYITLAPVATVLGLAVKLRDPENLLGRGEDLGISCALIPAKTPGVNIGRRHWPISAPFMNGPTSGNEVFVPLDMLIGGPVMAGQGWRMLMECLSVGRAISLPSGSTGTINGLSRLTSAYAAVRQQFGMPIANFEGISEALARMGTRNYAATAVRWMTASMVDMGDKPSVPSAIAKYSCTSMLRESSIDAMDIHAGKAVMVGPANPIANAYMSAPVSITVEGANILTRSLMIFGQGAMRCHPYVREEIDAIAEGSQARFGRALMAHIGHAISAASRSLVLGLIPALAPVPERGGVHVREIRSLARYSANLALLTELCFATLGGKLKFAESISGRLADVLSQLYIASCALKRFEDDGQPQDDLPLLRSVCAQANHNIEEALHGVLHNLPSRPAAWLARALIFPLGRRASGVSDAQRRDIARLMTTPGPARDRLTASCWTPHAKSSVAVYEVAFAAQRDIAPLQKRLAKAVREGQLQEAAPAALIAAAGEAGILAPHELEQMQQAQALIHELVAVDDFRSQDMARKPARTTSSKTSASRAKSSPRKTTARKSTTGKSTRTAKDTEDA